MSNIVQAEFFHVRNSSSLAQLEKECTDRMLDGASIKTSVRFIDSCDRSVRFIHMLDRSRKRVEKARQQYHAATGIQRLWYGMRYYQVLRTIDPERDSREQLAFAQELFRHATHTSNHIAVESSDHSFRMMRDDEKYDLVTAVSRAKRAWIFVFEPNHLCADKNKLVASCTF